MSRTLSLPKGEGHEVMKIYYTYLARCHDDTLYTGYCTNIKQREQKHNQGEGAKYTRQRRPIKIIYWEEYDTIVAAMRREKEIKKWRREKKMILINTTPL